jgi:hypothetical protein
VWDVVYRTVDTALRFEHSTGTVRYGFILHSYFAIRPHLPTKASTKQFFKHSRIVQSVLYNIQSIAGLRKKQHVLQSGTRSKPKSTLIFIFSAGKIITGGNRLCLRQSACEQTHRPTNVGTATGNIIVLTDEIVLIVVLGFQHHVRHQ